MSANESGPMTYLCSQQVIVFLLFAMGCVGLVLTLISFVVLETGSGPFIISAVNLVGIVALIIGSGYVLWKCNQY